MRGEPRQKCPEPLEIGTLIQEEGVIVGATKRQQGAGFGGSREDCFAMVERDDLVIATVNDQHGAMHVPNVIARRVAHSAQPARREPWIKLLGNIWNGREGRFHDEGQGMLLRGQP